MTTRADPQRRRTVIDLLGGIREYVYPVGRLDYDTEGLLLLTNDGELAAKLTHPRHQIDRTYEARVAGVPDEGALEQLRAGIPLDGRRTLPAAVKLLGGSRDAVLLITIREGRNRQVRRMLLRVGHPVKRLRRVRLGPLELKGLAVGEWRELTSRELAALRPVLDSFVSWPTDVLRPPTPLWERLAQRIGTDTAAEPVSPEAVRDSALAAGLVASLLAGCKVAPVDDNRVAVGPESAVPATGGLAELTGAVFGLANGPNASAIPAAASPPMPAPAT